MCKSMACSAPLGDQESRFIIFCFCTRVSILHERCVYKFYINHDSPPFQNKWDPSWPVMGDLLNSSDNRGKTFHHVLSLHGSTSNEPAEAGKSRRGNFKSVVWTGQNWESPHPKRIVFGCFFPRFFATHLGDDANFQRPAVPSWQLGDYLSGRDAFVCFGSATSSVGQCLPCGISVGWSWRLLSNMRQ